MVTRLSTYRYIAWDPFQLDQAVVDSVGSHDQLVEAETLSHAYRKYNPDTYINTCTSITVLKLSVVHMYMYVYLLYDCFQDCPLFHSVKYTLATRHHFIMQKHSHVTIMYTCTSKL